MKYKSYDGKMFLIYKNIIREKLRITRWKIWQKINRRLLKTYLHIEEMARCELCGRNVHDYHVPDEIWNRIYGDETGTLCYDCFCDECDKQGINFRLS